MLAKRGHEVTWWASTFNPIEKKQRYERDYSANLEKNYRIELIHARGYRKGVSLRRFLYHRQMARKFAHCIQDESPPDVILSSYPTPELSRIAVDWGRCRDVPVVVDIRDLWPDALLNRVSRVVRWLVHLGSLPVFRNHVVFRDATGIIAISSEYLRWGLRHAGREQRKTDRVFYMGYPRTSIKPALLQEAKDYWGSRGVNKELFICCFFGTINYHFDLDTVITAARHLESLGESRFQFVICGSGSHLERCERLASGLRNVIFPGWVDLPRIVALMEMSTVGLAPYAAGASMSLPNKPFEYFSGGLPVVSSLHGELEALLAEHNCGLTYEAGDVRGLLKCLCQLRADPQQRQGMGRNARQLFEGQFSAECVYPAMIDYLERIAGGELRS
jgi:glycosyltransferase involved in cell wall biosynthesis